jgi:uncharacterized protein
VTVLYLDTSIVVPLFIEELKSATIRRFLRTEAKPVVTSDLTRLEFASVIGRRVREGSISPRSGQQAIFFCDQWMINSTEHIGLEARHIEGARSMLCGAFDLNLRAPDALHLSLVIATGSIFVTDDKRLKTVAPEFGIQLAWRGLDPALQ